MTDKERDALVADIALKINSTFETKLKNLINPRLEKLEKSMHTMQTSVDRIDDDMSGDRKDIGDLKVDMGTIRSQFQEIKDLFSQQTRTIVHKLEGTVSATIETATEGISDSVEAAVDASLEQFVANKPKVTKKERSWLDRLLFWRKK